VSDSPAQGLTLTAGDAARAHVARVVRRSGSSFALGMRMLPPDRRAAMYAIYAFCREVDDIADEPGEVADKVAALQAWRAEIDKLYQGRPSRPTSRALMDPVSAFALPKEEFVAVIDGMEMDAREEMLAPSWEDFRLYCRRVAGAVGALSIHVFGDERAAARELAVVEGEALQFTNVLRDVAEDARIGRLYLPRNLLEAEGIATRDPGEVLAHPALARVCAKLAEEARARFATARKLIGRCDRRRLKPAIIMLEVYSRLLDRLEARGWERLGDPVKVPRRQKLWILLRHGLL
jgi:phytoene synthase